MLSVEIKNNDIYFMEIVGEKIIINDGYKGILILDMQMQPIKSIEIIEDITIYSSFFYKNEILLFCPDNNCLVYINIVSYKYNVISLGETWSPIFSTLYCWNEMGVILSTFKGEFVKVNLQEKNVEKIPNDLCNILCPDINKLYMELYKYQVYKVFVQEHKAFIEKADKKMCIFDYANKVEKMMEFTKSEYHDIDIKNGYIAKIGENIANVQYNEKQKTFYPTNNYVFLKGKFMISDNYAFLFLLSSSQECVTDVRIDKYNLLD